MSQSGPDKKEANSLIALSSAAVLAVYTAGFVKTKAAAAHLEALESRVRPALTAPASLPIEAHLAALPAEPLVAAAPEVAKIAEPKVSVPAQTAPQTKPEVKVDTAVVQPAPVTEAPVPAPVEAVVVVPPPVPAPAPPPVPAAPPQPAWKDGTYLGWGSARHGSIQASVEVAGGHIAVAKIEQCQMRYSCSMIDSLIPQVAQRGNPEKIDYISGATESSNVFYWALVDALSKAK
jgi:uncharacterized protein with FMN-binding domain